MKTLKILLTVLLILSLLFMAVYGICLCRFRKTHSGMLADVEMLRSGGQTPVPSPAGAASAPIASPSGTSQAVWTPSPTAWQDPLLLHFQSLHEANPDFIGWVSLDSTTLDDPVMHSPDRPEYYLHRSFDKTYSFAGTPFADARCDPLTPSGNVILYGHNMKSGDLFAALTGYTDEAFFRSHPVIRFDTLAGRRAYTVFAVLAIRLSQNLDNERMLCYSTSLTADEGEIQSLKDYLHTYALHLRNDAFPSVGDNVLTLSTCTGFQRADRLIVMAASQ